MNTKLIAGSALTGLVLAGGIASMVSAQTVADQTGLTEEQVIEIALSEVPGEVIEVEAESRRGQDFFEVEIMAEDGTETEVKVDAASGEVLKVKADRDDCDDDDDDDNGEQDA